MGFVDYLEAWVRITLAYPFSDEEQIDLHNFEARILFLLNKLENKFADAKTSFEKKVNINNAENMKYQPRVVVDEDDEDYMN